MFDLRQNTWPPTTRQCPAQFDCLWVGQPWPSLDLQQQQQLACYVQSASLTDWVNYWRRLFAPSCNIRRWITVGQVTAAAWHFDDDDPTQAIAKLKRTLLKHTTHLHANERCQWKMINKVMPSSVYLPQRRRLCDQADCLCVCVFLSAIRCY